MIIGDRSVLVHVPKYQFDKIGTNQVEGKEQDIIIGNLNLSVHRNGIPFHAYKLTSNDFSICFMDKEMKDNPPIKVRFLAGYLWSFGYKPEKEKTLCHR